MDWQECILCSGFREGEDWRTGGIGVKFCKFRHENERYTYYVTSAVRLRATPDLEIGAARTIAERGAPAVDVKVVLTLADPMFF